MCFYACLLVLAAETVLEFSMPRLHTSEVSVHAYVSQPPNTHTQTQTHTNTNTHRNMANACPNPSKNGAVQKKPVKASNRPMR